MRSFTLNEKTGFQINEPNTPVNIRDERGILFYTTEPILPTYFFNLPKGRYFVDSGNFTPLRSPVNFRLQKLPPAEKAFGIKPTHFKIEFAPNPDKCTIYWPEKLIVYDTSFEDKPQPQTQFIFEHECGHSMYGYQRPGSDREAYLQNKIPGVKYFYNEAEGYCDMYASNEMLKKGYNPSQIMAAPRETLSDRQEMRKELVEETMLQNNGY